MDRAEEVGHPGRLEDESEHGKVHTHAREERERDMDRAEEVGHPGRLEDESEHGKVHTHAREERERDMDRAEEVGRPGRLEDESEHGKVLTHAREEREIDVDRAEEVGDLGRLQDESEHGKAIGEIEALRQENGHILEANRDLSSENKYLWNKLQGRSGADVVAERPGSQEARGDGLPRVQASYKEAAHVR